MPPEDIGNVFSGLFDGARAIFKDFIDYQSMQAEADLARDQWNAQASYLASTVPRSTPLWSNPDGGVSLTMVLLLGGAALGLFLLLRR